MKNIVVVFLFVFLLSACSPKPSPEFQAAQTQIANDKLQIDALQTLVGSIRSSTPRVVTATLTATPKYTPTITMTPTITLTPTPTKDPRVLPKSDGFYLIGTEIMPGVWRSTGNSDRCYWSVTQANGEIIDNHYGMAGGTAWIAEYGFQVEFSRCGNWEYIGK